MKRIIRGLLLLLSVALATPSFAQLTDRLSGIQAGLAVKAPVAAVTNAAITLSGEQTVNGVALVAGDRVLVKNQTDTTTNGIYVVSTSAWSRATDFDGNRDATQGTIVVLYNASNPGVFYQLTTANPVVIGTSAITFSALDDPAITYPQTGAEAAASVTPADTSYKPGYIERYAALIDGAADDTDAWQAATDQSCQDGGSPVVFESGTSMAALIDYCPGATYIMGSGAVLKSLPSTADFAGRIFTCGTGKQACWDDAADSAPITWIGGTIDGNKANQGSYTSSEKEHNAGIFLGGLDGGGHLVARIRGVKFQNFTGDGLQVHSNVDATVSDSEFQDDWRSGLAITGAYVNFHGSNLWLHGTSTDRSDFDIEVDGYDQSYNNIESVNIAIDNMQVDTGTFEVSPASTTETSSDSRIFLSNINHRGISTTMSGRGSIVRISDSVLTYGPIDDSNNRIIWPADFTFQNVRFVFSEGSVSATSTFGVDVWGNTGGTTDTNQLLRFINCRFGADSTVESGDTVYGVYRRASAATTNNVTEIDGGHFDSTLDEVYHTLGGGKLVVKDSPTFDAVTGISLTYSSTNYWDVTILGSIYYGPNNTASLAIDQGNSSNVLRHFGSMLDEANDTITAGGGSPQNNTFYGSRRIYVAATPDASTPCFVGDIATIKAPAAGGDVDYVCTTYGFGSGAVWKLLTAAAM